MFYNLNKSLIKLLVFDLINILKLFKDIKV